MEQKTVLEIDKNAFTLTDLLRKAAEFKGLELQERSTKAYSKPFKTYFLDDELLASLAERNIKHHDRSDDIYTLVDKNPQNVIPGWAPSRHWNFKYLPDRSRFDLSISLSVGFGLSIARRGVLFFPRAYGSFVSPADQLPHTRMFKALVENDDGALPIAKEMSASEDGNTIVTWTDLGLGGIRSLSGLFTEFSKGSGSIEELGVRGHVFEPQPYNCPHPGNELFIVESAQPVLFQVWQAQLKRYRDSLNIV